MSVYVIFIKNGAKYMSPIKDQEAYLALRDSEQNRKAEKRNMVQMNYSCLPNEDGSLRGSTRISNTVGMDVDLDEATHALEKETHEIQNRILSKKEELGLLMLEQSASKGYHLVFRRKEDLSQEENLRWASELLGVEYDKGAKDITRVFYTPADKLLFLDQDLFEVKECALVQHVDNHRTAGSVLPSVNKAVVGVATEFSRHAFDLCVEQAGLSSDELDVWGEHNWHSNLMAVLSVGLPKLMSQEQLLAVVQEKLPNYSGTDDCRKLIDYFYEKYTADKGFMSVTLRDINARAQKMAQPVNQEEGDDEVLDDLTQSWAPPEIPKKIPRLMNLLVGNYDVRFQEMLLLSALPVLSAHASHFRAKYLNGKVVGCQQFVAVIGGSGSGKSNCTNLFNEMILNTLKANDDREWEKVRENAELRDRKANADDKPQKYHPKLRIFETTSKTSILELQTNLGKNGMLLGQFSEADALSGATHTAYTDISVLLRKGWDGDMHRQFYMSDASCNTYTIMNISLLMAGTPKAMLERMFSESNCEGGLMQRCIPVIVPKKKRTFRPPCQGFLSDEEKMERDSLLLSLYQKDLEVGDEIVLLDLPLMNKAIGEWFDELEERYNDGLLTDAEADLSHRCGEFMLRAAIPLVALYGKETKEIIDFCRWVGEVAHYNMCRIFGQRVQKDIQTSNELLDERIDCRKKAEPLLNRLPVIFSVEELQNERKKSGQSTDVKKLLTRYCKSGKLEKVGKKLYRRKQEKGDINYVPKMSDPTSPAEALNQDDHGNND